MMIPLTTLINTRIELLKGGRMNLSMKSKMILAAFSFVGMIPVTGFSDDLPKYVFQIPATYSRTGTVTTYVGSRNTGWSGAISACYSAGENPNTCQYFDTEAYECYVHKNCHFSPYND